MYFKKISLSHFDNSYTIISMSQNNNSNNNQQDHGLVVEDKTQEPKQYKVLMHNDDYTPMEFVIFVLKRFFSKNETEATQIMLDVHHKGVGLAGIYSFEVAETKVEQSNQFAKINQHPLKTSYEEA
jgi:ATP-dependent Clp protease adaptor protein ClpS